MKVSTYFFEWLAMKRPDLERSTYEAYIIYITRHIAPYFDALGKELEALKPLDIKAYVTYKRTDGRKDGKPGGLAPVSVRKHLNIIKQALREAVLYEVLPKSPADPVRVPKAPPVSAHAQFITVERAREMLAALEGHPLHDLVYVTLYYGLRRSEVLGLKWEAVDFVQDTLTIQHTVVKASTIEAKDRTKTASSHRTFPLLPEVKTLLQERKARQTTKSPYIFTNEKGILFRPDYVTRGFQRAIKAKGLPVIRFHDLRHATATILFDRGWTVADVQHWLGHTDIETTFNIYVAYGRGRKIALGGSLAGLFDRVPEKPETPDK